MATQTPYMTDSDWISRLEGQIEHLATKADLERLRADVERMISEVRADMLKLFFALTGANIAIVSAGIAFLRLSSGA